MSAQGQLIVVATPGTLDRVRGVVSMLRDNHETTIDVEARLVEIRLDRREELLRRVGIAPDFSEGDGPRRQATLDPLQSRILLARIGHLERHGGLLATASFNTSHAQRAWLQATIDPGDMLDIDLVRCEVQRTGLSLELRAIRPAQGRVRIAGAVSTKVGVPLDIRFGPQSAPARPADGTRVFIESLAGGIPFNVEMGDGETLVLDAGIREHCPEERPMALLVLISASRGEDLIRPEMAPASEAPVLHRH